MGLDMYMNRRLKSAQDTLSALLPQLHSTETDESTKEAVRNEISGVYQNDEDVAYFRKHNALRSYIVENFYKGDDGDSANIVCVLTEENLKQILDTIVKVCKDHSLAQQLFPTGAGFFFGSYDYDDWYFEQLKDECQLLQTIVDTTDFDTQVIEYSEWW